MSFDASSVVVLVFLFKQKTAYEMRISDWSSDVCSSDLEAGAQQTESGAPGAGNQRPVTPAAAPGTAVPHTLGFKVKDSWPDGFVGEKIGRASCRERVCQYV